MVVVEKTLLTDKEPELTVDIIIREAFIDKFIADYQ